MKKLIAGLLVLIMALMLLIACAPDESDENKEEASNTQSELQTEGESESERESEPEAEVVEYGLWIGEVRVTNRNQHDVLGDGTVVYEGDDESGTLRLTDAQIETVYEFEEEMEDSTGICSKIKNLTLELTGRNRIGGGTVAPMTGFSARDLTIRGEGTLAVSGNKFGLLAENTTVVSGTVTAFALENEGVFMNIGFAAFGHLRMEGGSIGGFFTLPLEKMGFGVYVSETLEIHGGSVEAAYMGASEAALPAISFSEIAFAEDWVPSIEAGKNMGMGSLVDDYTTYKYRDAYILIH